MSKSRVQVRFATATEEITLTLTRWHLVFKWRALVEGGHVTQLEAGRMAAIAYFAEKFRIQKNANREEQ